MIRYKLTRHLWQSVAISAVATGLAGAPLFIYPKPADATVLGYNGKVAISKFRPPKGPDIALSDGGDLTWLTDNTGLTPPFTSSWYPQWSPDGTKIAFESNRDGNSEIYVMNADGSNQTRLTTALSHDNTPQWSPDGSKIAFVSQRDGNSEIYSMNSDGSEQTRLTNASGTDTNLRWSPEGPKIVFTSDRDGNSEIYIMNADGSGQIRLTNDTTLDTLGANPWSPDGTKIAFSSGRDGNNEIYVMNADGSNQTRLTTSPRADLFPSWSPDGTQIAWQSSMSGVYELRVMSVDGSDMQQLASDMALVTAIVWSPDGQRLLYLSKGVGFLGDAATIRRDGTEHQLLTETGATSISDGLSLYWITIPNTPPVLAAKTLAVGYQTAGSVDVLTGSTDEEALSGSNLTMTVQPTHGTAAVNASLGKIDYTPADGYSGPDSLTYRICDVFTLDQKCSTAVLGITVAEPGAPVLTVSKASGQNVAPGGTYTSPTTKPTFSGTASPHAQITVEIHSDPIILTTTTGNDGNWSVTPSQPLPPGNHTVTISATLNGKTTTLESFVLGIQDEIPNTGANTDTLRTIGVAALVAGGGLTLYRRRSSKRVMTRVPQLFP